MTDFDAANALLLLSAGSRAFQHIEQIENNNNGKLRKRPVSDKVQADGVRSTVKRAKLDLENEVSVRASKDQILVRDSTAGVAPKPAKMPYIEVATIPIQRIPADRMIERRLGSSSPELAQWDSSRASSPISGQQISSSDDRANTSEKLAHSPADSGVSSIHDDVLQPFLALQLWEKGLQIAAILPDCVRDELNKIASMSTHNKKQFTDAKMEKFPVEMSFNPRKSRMRKEFANEIDHMDRVKSNDASRRSRHKKKLMIHMMNASLEYDRQENQELYMQERWLTNMIYELEERAISQGVDAQMLRKMRDACGLD